jgi:electron transport complex protein RnfD
MARVLIALAPCAIYGIVIFGARAALTIAVALASAEAAEALFRLAARRPLRNSDLSAAVTGLLLALVLPPGVPLWMTAIGAVFAIVVAKEFFGGLGANIFNPALAGRAFLLMSFPAAMTTWHKPALWGAPLTDALSTATPLGALKMGADVTSGASLHFGVDFSGVESALGVSSYGEMLKKLFFGYHAGTIGETSVLLILAGAFFLLVTKTIDWRAPLTMTGTAFVCSLALGQDPIFAILSGGLLFGAVFMATDYTSAPVTATGKLLFGAGAGLITVLIRRWGGYPEGVTYGLLIMNAAAPFLNKLLQRKYGYVKPAKKKGGAQ